MFPTPSEKPEDVTRRVLVKVNSDKEQRERRRVKLAKETGYPMLLPGMF
jgi:hypothetical protein